MPIYHPATAETVDRLREVLEAYHPDLVECGVSVGLLMVHAKPDANGEIHPPALKLHGYPCYAVVRIHSLKLRAQGHPDALIELDGDSWSEHTDLRQRAILDHELTHLVVQRDDQGQIKTDDLGRPRLKMRPHDLHLGGFAEVIQRHGTTQAVEAQAYADIHRRLVQLELFPLG